MPPQFSLFRSLPATVRTQANNTSGHGPHHPALLRDPRCTANACLLLLNFRSFAGSCTDQAPRRGPATREARNARCLQARGGPRAGLGCWASWRVLPALRCLGRLASGCCTRGVRHAVHHPDIPQRVRMGSPHHRQAVERPPTPRGWSPNSQKSCAW